MPAGVAAAATCFVLEQGAPHAGWLARPASYNPPQLWTPCERMTHKLREHGGGGGGTRITSRGHGHMMSVTAMCPWDVRDRGCQFYIITCACALKSSLELVTRDLREQAAAFGRAPRRSWANIRLLPSSCAPAHLHERE